MAGIVTASHLKLPPDCVNSLSYQVINLYDYILPGLVLQGEVDLFST